MFYLKKKKKFHSRYKTVRSQNISVDQITATYHYMGNTINTVGIVGVPQILVNAQKVHCCRLFITYRKM